MEEPVSFSPPLFCDRPPDCVRRWRPFRSLPLLDFVVDREDAPDPLLAIAQMITPKMVIGGLGTPSVLDQQHLQEKYANLRRCAPQ